VLRHASPSLGSPFFRPDQRGRSSVLIVYLKLLPAEIRIGRRPGWVVVTEISALKKPCSIASMRIMRSFSMTLLNSSPAVWDVAMTLFMFDIFWLLVLPLGGMRGRRDCIGDHGYLVVRDGPDYPHPALQSHARSVPAGTALSVLQLLLKRLQRKRLCRKL